MINEIAIREGTVNIVNDEKFLEALESCALHKNHLNEIANLIYFNPIPNTGKPYWIETYSELNSFPTWDDAFDTLLDHIYKASETDNSENDDVFIPGQKNNEGRIIYPCSHSYCPADFCRDKRRTEHLQKKAIRHRQRRIERRQELGDEYDSDEYESFDSYDCGWGYRGENDDDY
jgi:hypothetical protein